MTTSIDPTTPARNGADPDAPASPWHTTALTGRTPAPVDVPDAPAAEPALVIRWDRIATVGWWLLALAVFGGVIRAATNGDAYRGGLAVLTVGLVAAVVIGIGERWVFTGRPADEDDPDGGV